MSNLLLFILGLVVVLVFIWRNAMQARERAVQAAASLCRKWQVTLLDQTVSLQTWRIRRSQSGLLGLKRTYCFEYTYYGYDRQKAYLVIFDNRLVAVEHPKDPTVFETSIESSNQANQQKGQIIDFHPKDSSE